MHIAIGMWGLMRSLPFIIDSFRVMCLKPILMQGHSYELFIHTYNFSGPYTNLRSKEPPMRLNFSDWKLLGADHVQIENQDVFDSEFPFQDYMSKEDPWNNNFTSFKNQLRALHSLHEVTLAIESASKQSWFDGVAFLRPDVQYLNELPVYLLHSHPNTLFLPKFHRDCGGGQYNDRMILADLTSALIYGKKLEGALEYSKHHQLHSETFTYDYLTRSGVSVVEIPFVFRRVRSTGLVHRRDRSLLNPEELSRLTARERREGSSSNSGRDGGGLEEVTPYPLKVLYSTLEALTLHKVYIWNHDDDNNQLCSPHKYISYEESREQRREVLEGVSNQTRSHKNRKQLKELLHSMSEADEPVDRAV